MKKKGLVILLSFFFITQISLYADEWVVDIGGSGNFTNIQDAINAAQNGDTVWVSSGTYTGNGNRDITFNGKAITLRSSSGAGSTIIDCQGNPSNPHRGFTFTSGEGSGSVVSGFTIQNGYAPTSVMDSYGHGYSAGGGIFCYGSSPTVEHCIITNNSAGYFGSGIACTQRSTPLITSCHITNNTTGNRGGGIYGFMHSGPQLVNCLIAGNSSNILGGGLYFESWSNASVLHCTIAENVNNLQESGGGIWCQTGSVALNNSILWKNIGKKIISLDSQYDGWTLNSSSSYNCILGYTGTQGGIGNIGVDPLFVGSGNYMLQLDSPCIDAAGNACVYTDLLGNERPCDVPGIDHNGILPDFDIGAYEVIPEPAALSLLAIGGLALLRKRK